MRGTSKIRLHRTNAWADFLRSYSVLIDDQRVARIRNGQTLEMEVAPGRHTIFLRQDWMRTNELSFELTENQVAEFECGSNMSGIKALFAIGYIFRPKEWMFIRQLSLSNPTQSPPHFD